MSSRPKPDPTRAISITMPKSLVKEIDTYVWASADVPGEYLTRSSMITKAVKEYLAHLKEVKNDVHS